MANAHNIEFKTPATSTDSASSSSSSSSLSSASSTPLSQTPPATFLVLHSFANKDEIWANQLQATLKTLSGISVTTQPYPSPKGSSQTYDYVLLCPSHRIQEVWVSRSQGWYVSCGSSLELENARFSRALEEEKRHRNSQTKFYLSLCPEARTMYDPKEAKTQGWNIEYKQAEELIKELHKDLRLLDLMRKSTENAVGSATRVREEAKTPSEAFKAYQDIRINTLTATTHRALAQQLLDKTINLLTSDNVEEESRKIKIANDGWPLPQKLNEKIEQLRIPPAPPPPRSSSAHSFAPS